MQVESFFSVVYEEDVKLQDQQTVYKNNIEELQTHGKIQGTKDTIKGYTRTSWLKGDNETTCPIKHALQPYFV